MTREQSKQEREMLENAVNKQMGRATLAVLVFLLSTWYGVYEVTATGASYALFGAIGLSVLSGLGAFIFSFLTVGLFMFDVYDRQEYIVPAERDEADEETAASMSPEDAHLFEQIQRKARLRDPQERIQVNINGM